MPTYRKDNRKSSQKKEEKIDNDIDGISLDDAEDKKNVEEIKRKSKRPLWKTILFCFLIILFIFFLIVLSVFFILRNKGKNDLEVKEQTVLYDGKKYTYRTDIVNILCLGVDKDLSLEQMESGRGNFGMTDAILLVSIDTKRDEVKIISIPRDTMAEVQMTMEDGSVGPKERAQICYQYAYGNSVEQCCELTVDAVSKLLYNIPIQKYCAVNFKAIPMLNDAIGGVDVVVQEHIEEWGTGFEYGENVHLEGEKALLYVRARNRWSADGTVMRAQRQKQYAFAFAQKAKSVVFKNPSLPIVMLQDLQESGNMSTDITIEDIVYLMPKMLTMSFIEDTFQTLPGESKVGESGFAEFYMDVDAVKDLIIDTFYEEV